MLGRSEEEQERRDQERAMAEMEEAWDAQATGMQTTQGDGTAGIVDRGGAAEERDLDAEVPDADAQMEGQDQSALEGEEENSGLQHEDVTGLEHSGMGDGMDSMVESSAQASFNARAAARGVSFPHQPSAFESTVAQSQINNRITPYQPQTPIIGAGEEEAEEIMMDGAAEDLEADLDADIPEADAGFGAYDDDNEEAGEEVEVDAAWEHTDSDASISSDDDDQQPIPPGRSMRLVSPSVNVVATPPTQTVPNSRTSGARSGRSWLQNATQRARESFSPPTLSSTGRSMRQRRQRGTPADDSSSPMMPGSITNASGRAPSGGGRLFSGRANPFQRHFSGSAAAAGNVGITSSTTAGEIAQSTGSASGGSESARRSSGGRVVSAGSTGRRGLSMREN
ncbi:MAG: hypothetical protein Q9160_008997 [Pyrenula sp. 1 TL-2023]